MNLRRKKRLNHKVRMTHAKADELRAKGELYPGLRPFVKMNARHKVNKSTQMRNRAQRNEAYAVVRAKMFAKPVKK